MTTEDREVIANILAGYTILILVSLCLLFISTEVAMIFTVVWLGFTFIAIVGMALTCVSLMLKSFYKKLLVTPPL